MELPQEVVVRVSGANALRVLAVVYACVPYPPAGTRALCRRSKAWIAKAAGLEGARGAKAVERASREAVAAGWVERVRAALTRWHEDFRDRAGAPPESLRRTLTTSAPRPTWAAALALALADGVTKQVGPMVALVEHEATMAHADRVLWEELEPLLLEGGLRPPRVRELAASVGEEPVRIEAVLRRAANLALVAPVAKNRFFPPPAIEALVESARQLAADQPDGRFTAQQYKDATGIGRNVAIEVLEYFDRAGITRRRGDTRILL
ncbi:MAG: SelB C-terminal domain-containing protein [Alphaproteobacteria bacterium]|nr:SelB C-terminal domain-containing protein [Alphaproteobacteria bacterium]